MHSVLSATRQNDPYFKKVIPVKDRFNQSINPIVFNNFTKQCPSYLNQFFELACLNNLRTIWFVLFKKLTQDKTHSLPLVPQYGIKPQRFSKKPNSINTFKRKLTRITTTVEPWHLKANGEDISLTQNYCITISIQIINSIHKFIFK